MYKSFEGKHMYGVKCKFWDIPRQISIAPAPYSWIFCISAIVLFSRVWHGTTCFEHNRSPIWLWYYYWTPWTQSPVNHFCDSRSVHNLLSSIIVGYSWRILALRIPLVLVFDIIRKCIQTHKLKHYHNQSFHNIETTQVNVWQFFSKINQSFNQWFKLCLINVPRPRTAVAPFINMV